MRLDIRSKGSVLLFTVLLTGTVAFAVDVYDGVRAPKGLYGLSYTTLYQADDFNDADGNSAISDFGYQAIHETLRLTYYTPDKIFTILVPFGHVESDYADESDSGLGDIILAAGGFLPPTSFDLQLLGAVKLPTGSFDENKQMNIGSGQADVYPAMFLHKSWDIYTFDAVVKYFFKFENEDTKVDPGDEFLLEATATRQFGPVKLGPQFKFLMGNDSEVDGKTLDDSGKQVIGLGAEAYFKIFGLSTTINYMADVYAENTLQGHLFRLKLCRQF